MYTSYKCAADIQYLPENALKEGLGMVKTLKGNIKKLELGSKLRQDVWLRDIERLAFISSPDIQCISYPTPSLQNHAAPTTMIAVCGGMSVPC